MKLFCLFFATSLLFGCVPNLIDIRQSEPCHILISNNNPKTLANCIAYESQTSPICDPAIITELEGTYKILIKISGGFIIPFNKPVAELTITPANSDNSQIEYRSFSHWYGKEKFWDLVKKCASPHNLSLK